MVFFPSVPVTQSLAVNLGLASAVGEIGVAWELTGLGPIALELGVGMGASGYQVSAMVKAVYLGQPHVVAVIGVGVSRSWSGGPEVPVIVFERSGNPIWLNLDLVSLEYRAPSHAFISVTGGFTKGLGGGTLILVPDGEGYSPQTDETAAWFVPQARAQFGFWF